MRLKARSMYEEQVRSHGHTNARAENASKHLKTEKSPTRMKKQRERENERDSRENLQFAHKAFVLEARGISCTN